MGAGSHSSWRKLSGAAIVVAGLLAGAALRARAQKTDLAAATLIERALTSTNIAGPGEPAFRMQGRVRLYNADGDHEEGNLLRIWTPSGLWHEELVLPDFQSVAVSDGREIWTSSNFDYVPFPVYQMDEALSFPHLLAAARQLDLGAPRKLGENGEECIEGNGKDPQKTMQYCFDSITGNLNRLIVDRWNLSYQFSEYKPFGAKTFPRLLRVLKSDGKPLADVFIERLSAEDRIDLRTFLPPHGARNWPERTSCGGVKAAKLVKMVKPEYPRAAQNVGVTGVVRFYIEVGIDGVPRGLWPLNATSPMLSRAAAAAVKQWRYSPQTCVANGAPLPLSTDVTVIFTSP